MSPSHNSITIQPLSTAAEQYSSRFCTIQSQFNHSALQQSSTARAFEDASVVFHTYTLLHLYTMSLSVSAAPAAPAAAAAAAAVLSSSSAHPSVNASAASAVSSSANNKEWDDLWPVEQILQLDDDDVLPTMVDSWFSNGQYRELVESWGTADLKKVCAKLHIGPVKGSGATTKMRMAIKVAIEKCATERAMDTDESDEDVPPRSSPSSPPRILGERRSRTQPAPATPSSRGPSDGLLAALASLPTAPKRAAAVAAASPRRSTGGRKGKKKRVQVDVDSESDPSVASSSSASSSSSDSSSESDSGAAPSAAANFISRKSRSRAIDDGVEESGMAKPLAKQFVRNLMAQAGRHGSAYEVYKYDVRFKKERNRRECMALARILDSLLSKEYKSALERLCRRLAGVHAADQGGDNWAICDAFELVMEKQSFVPDAHLQRAVKSVMRLQALETAGTKSDNTRSRANKPSSAGGGSKYSAGKGGARPSSSSSSQPGAPLSSSRKKSTGNKGGSDD
jgi:hypothetical protein